MTLNELNALDVGAATRELARCCGSTRWADAMATARPFQTADDLYRAADEVWWSLDSGDWLEAFGHHPRIGERTAGWAKDEQAGARGAAQMTLDSLTALNREYERKFGHVFLIFATGKSADDMLGELRRRLTHDPAPELRIAAGEQAKITRLRLQKLLAPNFEQSRTG
jgi:2-oxo-4-hydroxy-4-carboxy-5-ureidoimidazoline decarboxylase